MYIADCLSCYVHLAETCKRDSRIADILDLAIPRRGGDDIEQFLGFVCSIHSKESGGRQETSVTFRHHKRFPKDDNITCIAEELAVKTQIKKKKKYTQSHTHTHKVTVETKGQTAEIKTNMI